MYLLDSCTISDFMKGDLNTMKKMKTTSPSLIYTSSITHMEIYYGLLRRFQKSHRYFNFLDLFLSEITVLPLDSNSAIQSAKIKTELEKIGLPIGAYDLLIAGIAVSENLTIVTSNEKEFSRVANLPLENWRNIP
jgi:tRNA(fMet)-specific endonuclease VapC